MKKKIFLYQSKTLKYHNWSSITLIEFSVGSESTEFKILLQNVWSLNVLGLIAENLTRSLKSDLVMKSTFLIRLLKLIISKTESECELERFFLKLLKKTKSRNRKFLVLSSSSFCCFCSLDIFLTSFMFSISLMAKSGIKLVTIERIISSHMLGVLNSVK